MDEECLWQPGSQSQSKTNFSSFYKYLKNSNLDFNENYEDLWKWSIENKRVSGLICLIILIYLTLEAAIQSLVQMS